MISKEDNQLIFTDLGLIQMKIFNYYCIDLHFLQLYCIHICIALPQVLISWLCLFILNSLYVRSHKRIFASRYSVDDSHSNYWHSKLWLHSGRVSRSKQIITYTSYFLGMIKHWLTYTLKIFSLTQLIREIIYNWKSKFWASIFKSKNWRWTGAIF